MPTVTRTWVDTTNGEIIEITWKDQSVSRSVARSLIAYHFLEVIGPCASLADYEEIEED